MQSKHWVNTLYEQRAIDFWIIYTLCFIHTKQKQKQIFANIVQTASHLFATLLLHNVNELL